MSFFWSNAATPTPTPATPAPEVTPATPEEASRPSTRRQTSTSRAHEFLELPPGGERDIARERLRRSSRSRTPSPHPRDAEAFIFNATMDESTVQRLMEAAIRATQATSTQQVQTLRKPDLPVFDRKNVEIWIRRVEAAYARVNCTSPALKFAHLESKFEVNADPIVDGFLFGDATEDSWNAFLQYLRDRHAPTTKDRALSVINGTPREGRTPSQLAAVMKDKAGSVTLDDILKQQLLKQLPADILKQLVDRVDKLNFEETAKLADAWFDRDGKPLLQTSATGVNHVASDAPQPNTSSTASASAAATAPNASFTPVFGPDDDETDINAIRFRQGQKQQFNVNNRGGSRGRGRGNSSGNSRPQSNNNTNSYGNSSSYSGSNSNSNSEKPKKRVCDFHIKFGEEARRCERWCMMWEKHQASKGKPAPRA